MKKIIIVLALAAGLVGLFLPVAQAANIVDVNFPCPGGNIPGFPECEPIKDGVPTNDFVGYILQAYQFGIGIVGIIAVGMIVYGGILIAWNTESIDKKGKGREMITSALTGIAVLFGSYLLLNTINPELVKFNLLTNIPAQCSDGKDNDKDGKIDYGGGDKNDPDCSSKDDFTEKADSGAVDEALKSLQTLCGTNGDPASIPRVNNEAPGVNGCEYRKMTYTGGSFYVGKDDDYYGEWVSDQIEAGTTIWSYPYFIKEKGTSTARCLIYAYKNGSSSLEKIDLDDELTMCSLNPDIKQKNSDSFSTGSSDKEIRDLLANFGVLINKNDCTSPEQTNCTSLKNLPSAAVNLLISLGQYCKGDVVPLATDHTTGMITVYGQCHPVITGGTEAGHASHGENKSIFDLRSTVKNDNEYIGEWLLKNSAVKKICTSETQSKFRKNCTTVEGNDHFHVEL